VQSVVHSGVDMDLKNWAVVGFKDDTGLGRLAADLISILGIGHHLVVPSERLPTHALDPSCDILLDPNLPECNLPTQVLYGLEGLIILERSSWYPSLLRLAKSLGIYTIGVPMWEWFKGDDERWRYCDLFVCPTHMAVNVLKQYGFENSQYIPVPLNIHSLPHREVNGPARLYVHNGGLIDRDDRKGTRDAIAAFKMTKRKDIRLLVRLQKSEPLPELDDRIQVEIGNVGNHGDLYREGDVALQPSKMEGVGYMVIEPFASGLPVITTDYPPMNEYIQTKELLVKTQLGTRPAYPSSWIKHAHMSLPDINALAKTIDWCAEHDMAEFSRQNRQRAEILFDPFALKQKWQEAIASIDKKVGLHQ
jgi:glycosyltransferase involved in cell wall biosynthesis